MNKLILAIILFGSTAHANYDLEYNVTTVHFFETCDIASRFENRSFACGKGITNPIIGLKHRETGFRGFVGLNSVGSGMFGATKTFNGGMVIGAYLQDITEFKKRKIKPLCFDDSEDTCLTPIIGYEMQLNIKKYKLFTILTPALATVGLGYKF